MPTERLTDMEDAAVAAELDRALRSNHPGVARLQADIRNGRPIGIRPARAAAPDEYDYDPERWDGQS